jgi:hypothetical protein
MTTFTQFTLHIISVVLMVGTLQLGFKLLGTDTMMTMLAVIGSLAFGFCWKRATDYLTDKND